MNLRHLLAAATATCAALVLGSGSALAHEKEDQLGKVTFATSCNAKAHAQFVTGVAMLHSFWFGEARKTFDAALKEDPNCAYPNRYRSIYGIARAADAAGDKRKAADHYNRLMALAKNADSSRPELAHAREYVAQR